MWSIRKAQFDENNNCELIKQKWKDFTTVSFSKIKKNADAVIILGKKDEKDIYKNTTYISINDKDENDNERITIVIAVQSNDELPSEEKLQEMTYDILVNSEDISKKAVNQILSFFGLN